MIADFQGLAVDELAYSLSWERVGSWRPTPPRVCSSSSLGERAGKRA